jgi:hypothetical protein
MKRFRESVAARLLAVAVALPLLAGALVTFRPEGSGIVWFAASIVAAIILSVAGVGWAIEESEAEAVGAILFLPPALLLYVPFVAFLGSMPAVRIAMGAAATALLALVAGATSFRARLSSSPRTTTHSA